jgi:hypothetical protein
MRIARSKMPRQDAGLKKGNKPSATSISAAAPSSRSQKLASAKGYFRSRFGAASPLPRIAAKKSLAGSSTITSDLLRKLAR